MKFPLKISQSVQTAQCGSLLPWAELWASCYRLCGDVGSAEIHRMTSCPRAVLEERVVYHRRRRAPARSPMPAVLGEALRPRPWLVRPHPPSPRAPAGLAICGRRARALPHWQRTAEYVVEQWTGDSAYDLALNRSEWAKSTKGLLLGAPPPSNVTPDVPPLETG